MDLRLVAATNQDLRSAVREGRFREDLYYRLNVIALRVPPLRERRDDIPLLAEHFLRFFGERNGRHLAGFARPAAEALVRYDWPGNVRELENCVRHALAVTAGPLIELRDLPHELRSMEPARANRRTLTYLEEVERRAILDVLDSTSGQRLSAAKLLGIGKTTLYSKLKEYGIEDGA